MIAVDQYWAAENRLRLVFLMSGKWKVYNKGVVIAESWDPAHAAVLAKTALHEGCRHGTYILLDGDDNLIEEGFIRREQDMREGDKCWIRLSSTLRSSS